MDAAPFNPDILVPITALVITFLIFRSWLLLRERRYVELQQTLRAGIAAGAEVPADVWNRLLRAADPQRADLRRAIVFAVLASAIAALAALLPIDDPNGRRALCAVAVVPGSLALMQLAFWRFWHRG